MLCGVAISVTDGKIFGNTGRRLNMGTHKFVAHPNISKINRVIKQHPNNQLLQSYFIIRSLRKYGYTKYGVRAEKGKINNKQYLY